jgi:hypothetical protein
MYTAYALLKNFHSPQARVQFNEFNLWRINQGDFEGLRRLQEIFPGMPSDFTYWVYEREYQNIPPPFGEWNSGYGGISFHVEDALLFFRLFKIGDISWCRLRIKNPDGTFAELAPYNVMSSQNSVLFYRFERDDVAGWEALASELPRRQAWDSTWFKRARRFFLYGGALEYNTYHNELDRIVDYVAALEATLVPEKDFYIGRRLRERGCALLNLADEDKQRATNLLRDFYNIRSTIVHGSPLSENQVLTAREHRQAFELIVRELLKAALRTFPAEEEPRREHLKSLFDITDEERAAEIERILRDITNQETRKAILTRLMNSE